MPVYSSGSRRPGRPSRAFRLAYFDARPRAGIQAVYDGRCTRDEAAQEERGGSCGITLGSANNLAAMLKFLAHFQEAKALLRKVKPVARRVLGDNHQITLMMRKLYGEVLCRADGATLDDFHEAVETLEDTARTARRVLGGAHPTVQGLESCLPTARAMLRARAASLSSDLD